jgi:hypothetical protein
MVDPSIDKADPFCYLAKSTTELAVVTAPRGTQVTFDGSLHCGAAELCFFTGSKMSPILCRQKTFEDGWLPIVHYSYQEGAIQYGFEAFASLVEDADSSMPVTFVRASIKNSGKVKSLAKLTAALRYSGQDHRYNRQNSSAFSPDWLYEITSNTVVRGGKVIEFSSAEGKLQAVRGVVYSKPFSGRDFNITERAENCLRIFEVALNAGETTSVVFRMPLNGIDLSANAQVTSVANADYDAQRAKVVSFFQDRLSQGMQISIPEEKVMNTWRTDLCYDWMSIWLKDGMWAQAVNKFQYNWFWLRDATYIIRMYDLYGHHDIAEKCLQYFSTFQDSSGTFASQPGQLDGFGQALFAMGQHALLLNDKEFGQKVYRQFPAAIAWLKKVREADEFHLLPPTNARDNEDIQGRYTGHNFWALLGARTAGRLARMLGHADDAMQDFAEYNSLKDALMKRIEEICGTNEPIPPGLDVEGGQDWGNLIGLYPTEVLDANDERVSATLEKMHREKFAEGLMTYKGRLHQYLTVMETQNHIVRGDQEKALEHFYQFLLHTGSCNEGFEWLAVPWGSRDVGHNFPPHGWGAAMFNLMLRNMLVMERGGDGGLTPREIHLFSVISPEWAKPGDAVAFERAPIDAGEISATIQFREDGADVKIEHSYRELPKSLVLHTPYFVHDAEIQVDKGKATKNGDAFVLDPEVTSASLTWKRDAVPARNYMQAVTDYKREYAARYEQYIRAGNKPVPVEAPGMLTGPEREKLFKKEWAGQKVLGISTGKPVTVSGGTQRTHPPELAVDGITRNPAGSSWWATGLPQWLQIDLQKPEKIDRIRVFPYWDGARHYQYVVDISQDAKEWKRVGDFSKNTKVSTQEGDMFRFDAQMARYVKVTVLSNSDNPNAHLVEVQVFRPGQADH